MSLKFLAFLLLPFLAFGHPFDYDLHMNTLPGKNLRTMITFHGYGANYQIAECLKRTSNLDITLVSFNFPDHDIDQKYDPQKASFGTIDELLPALYVMKSVVVDQKLDAIDLYGFSAGGAAVINAIAVLNSTTYDPELKKIGIGEEEKKRLLAAIQRGIVILDVPLKSIEEIIAFRGTSKEFEILAKNYRDNNFRPIDSLKALKGLHVLLYFDKNDDILSNRDDQLFIERLRQFNKDAKVIIGSTAGHNAPHYALWEAYSELRS